MSFSQFPAALEKLGTMTAVRDTAALGQSLLKLVGSVFGISEPALYVVNAEHECIQSIHQQLQVVVDANGVERIIERQETVYTNIVIPEDVTELMSSVRFTLKPSYAKSRNQSLEEAEPEAGALPAVTLPPVLAVYPLCLRSHQQPGQGRYAGQLHGYLVLRANQMHDEPEINLLTGILQIYTNYYALLDESQRDQLTGLYNRHALDSSIEQLWPLLPRPQQNPRAVRAVPEDSGRGGFARRQKPERPQFWMALIDIDHFKRINDSYGHLVGDEILLLLSRLLTDTFRRGDRIYRYGGEEFLVIISTATEQLAKDIFERVRQRIESHHFPQAGKVTISTGYTVIDPHYSAQEAIERADRALYQAKHDGRNLCYCYETLRDGGVLRDINYGSAEIFHEPDVVQTTAAT